MNKSPKTREISHGIRSSKRPPARKLTKKARRSATSNKAHGTASGGTKQALLIDLLKRKKGATLADLVTATGWQKHSLRGAISGTLKKKLGLAVTTAVDEPRGRVYRISGGR